jgi:vitamin B12/bleomycin/antimicrobial peptide transport system ATP-binding/permease protein
MIAREGAPMPAARKPGIAGRRLLATLYRLGRIYWASPDGKRGAAILALAVALELGTVYGNFQLAYAEGRIMDALEQKQAAPFFAATGAFLGVMLAFVVVSTYRIYARQALEIRWRRGLTGHFVERWVSGEAFCQARLHGGEVDNPDQRIAEDVREFVASALGLSLSLLAALVTLLSFGGLLWTLSRHFTFDLAGSELRLPGILLWVALGYAVLSTWFTHLVGRRLVPINFDRLRAEADFRYGLVHFRDHCESVALSRGEPLERLGALVRFRSIVENWWQLIRAQRNLTLLTTGVGQTNGLVPLLVAAPAYIAGHLTLGSVAQVRFAYGQVSGALTWFVNAYQEIARWRASIERLATLLETIDATERDLAHAGLRVVASDTPALRLADLQLEAPDGSLLLERANATARPGERVAITGPSGSGKTILLRAVAGIWPFGSGRIEVPPGTRVLFVPQQTYLPLGSLRAVISYPSAEGTFPDERVREALRLLGLGHLEAKLDDVAPWDQELSGSERQRLAFARVLLNEPDWVFLDKATSELDESMEKRVYELLAEKLPESTVISVAHRPSLLPYHSRLWRISPHDVGPASLQAA